MGSVLVADLYATRPSVIASRSLVRLPVPRVSLGGCFGSSLLGCRKTVLKLAIEAKLPLITIFTDDTVNIGTVLSTIAGEKFSLYAPNLSPKIDPEGLYYIQWAESVNLKALYHAFTDRKATLVVVNPEVTHTAAFDAGVVTTPPIMVERFVQKYGDSEHHDGLMAALAGLSYEQVFQISQIAQAKHGVYTPKAVRDIRRTFFGTVRGLQMLSTDFLFYAPDPTLTEWLAESGRFLTEFDVPPLTPRGLLFKGPPGTGKTMGAKYLARELDLPLYHLDIASLMAKYVGESETNLRIALKQAEQSAPCIVVIDEVEKLFNTGTDDGGVTSRMLSSILWWLQEHKAKVFTVMTTNKEAAIPPELYRPGRIDDEIGFKKLNVMDSVLFAQDLTFVMTEQTGIKVMPPESADFEMGYTSHAAITTMVVGNFKKAFLQSEGGKNHE